MLHSTTDASFALHAIWGCGRSRRQELSVGEQTALGARGVNTSIASFPNESRKAGDLDSIFARMSSKQVMQSTVEGFLADVQRAPVMITTVVFCIESCIIMLLLL